MVAIYRGEEEEFRFVLFDVGDSKHWGPMDGSVWDKPTFMERGERWQEGVGGSLEASCWPLERARHTWKPQVPNAGLCQGEQHCQVPSSERGASSVDVCVQGRGRKQGQFGCCCDRPDRVGYNLNVEWTEVGRCVGYLVDRRYRT